MSFERIQTEGTLTGATEVIPGSGETVFTPMEIVSGDRHTSALVSSGTVSTGAGAPGPSVERRALLSRPPSKELAVRIRLAFNSCRDAVDRALESVDDLIAKTNALNDLRDALGRLWQQRESREEQFGDLIHHLQSLILDVPREELPADHITAIGKVIERASLPPALTDPDLRSFEEILVKAGCNVFRELE